MTAMFQMKLYRPITWHILGAVAMLLLWCHQVRTRAFLVAVLASGTFYWFLLDASDSMGETTRKQAETALARKNSAYNVADTAPKIQTRNRGAARQTPPPREGGTGAVALEDDQCNERHHSTMVFSSFRVPQGGINDCWRIPTTGRSAGVWARWGPWEGEILGLQRPRRIRQQYRLPIPDE